MLKYFFWYYSGGTKKFILIWRDFLRFILFYFSVGFLIKTLFSPWHKDISFPTWRGLHPILFMKNLANNLISRFMGMIVRLVVILVGILLDILLLVVGFFIFILWILAPLISILSIIFIIFTSNIEIKTILISILAISLSLILISIVSFFNYGKRKLEEMSLFDLAKEDWFIRVWNRMGFLKPQIEIINYFSNQKELENKLADYNLTLDDFKKIVDWELKLENEKISAFKFWEREALFSKQPIGKQWAYGFTVNLDRYSRDIQESEASTEHKANLIGHQKELKMAELALERPSQNSLILVGDPGVGKETFINFLAKRIKEQKEKNSLGNKRLVELDLKDLINNQSSEWIENEIGKIFYEAAFAGNVVLVINDLHEFLDPKKGKIGVNIGKILADFLSIPSFQLIGTISSQSYHDIVEKNNSIMKNVDVVNFTELTEEETLEALLWWLKRGEEKRVLVTYQALKKIVELSAQFINNIPFPEKTIDSLEEITMSWTNPNGNYFITEEDINKFFSEKFNVPLGKIESEEKDKLVNLEDILHLRIIGQEEAIKNISEAMRRSRSGISDNKKLIGSFLFMGPTGVGKTETAKAFTEAYFGNENRIIRFDMTEFQGADSVERFIGSKSRGENSQFVDKVSDNPFSVILFDEIEKANPEILNLLLQVLDEGWITDVFGKKAMLNNTIIIATSNAGADLIEKGCSEGIDSKMIYENILDYVVKEEIFRPEFLNRFSKVILFRSLEKDELFKATALVLKEISERVHKNKKITLTFEEGITEKIIEKGYDHTFGMRSVKHFAQNTVEDIIAKKLISEEWDNGTEAEISLNDLERELESDSN